MYSDSMLERATEPCFFEEYMIASSAKVKTNPDTDCHPGLAIGRTVSGLCPCTDPIDRYRYQNSFRSGPVQQNPGRSQVRYDSNAIWETKSQYRPGFGSGTRDFSRI